MKSQEIIQELEQHCRVAFFHNEGPLQGKQIAVDWLVRLHSRPEEIKQALAKHGLDSNFKSWQLETLVTAKVVVAGIGLHLSEEDEKSFEQGGEMHICAYAQPKGEMTTD